MIGAMSDNATLKTWQPFPVLMLDNCHFLPDLEENLSGEIIYFVAIIINNEMIYRDYDELL